MVSRLFSRSKKNSSPQEVQPTLFSHAQVDDDVFLPDSGRTPDNQVPKIYPNLTGILTGVGYMVHIFILSGHSRSRL